LAPAAAAGALEVLELLLEVLELLDDDEPPESDAPLDDELLLGEGELLDEDALLAPPSFLVEL
jgi:hypothetical protein